MDPLLGLVILLAVGAVSAWAVVVLHTAWIISHPPRRGYTYALAKGMPSNPAEIPPADGGPRRFREWSLRGTPTRPGTPGPILFAWDIEGDDPQGPVVVFSHGWGESRIHALARLPVLARHAQRVVLYDLRGHGESAGVSHLGTAEVGDLHAIIAAAIVAGDHHPATSAGASVVLAGFSLGAGISIAAAAHPPAGIRVSAVIAEAPYRLPGTPAARVLHAAALPHRLTLAPALALLGVLFRQGPRWATPTRSRTVRKAGSEGGGGSGGGGGGGGGGPPTVFDRAALARALGCPLLVLHASDDAIVPVDDARAIADAAPSGRLVRLEGAGHTDAWSNPASRASIEAAIGSFLRALPASPAPYDAAR